MSRVPRYKLATDAVDTHRGRKLTAIVVPMVPVEAKS